MSREDYIDRVRTALIDGQGFCPENLPSDDAIGLHVDRAIAYVEHGGGWSVVSYAVETIKQACVGPARDWRDDYPSDSGHFG